MLLDAQLRQKLADELRRSERIVMEGSEVVPRFRVITAEGDYHILVPMPDDELERLARMRLVAGFMVWKMATAFIVSAEIKAPDALYTFAVARDIEASGVIRPIKRDPLQLGPAVPLGPEQCGAEFLLMLPSGRTTIDAEMLADLEEAFGLDGEMEAQRVN